MLKLENICIEVNDKKILNNINMTIGRNEVCVIMGPNGVGKSTLVRAIMGDSTYTISKGKIIYNNEVITGLKPNEISKKGIFLLAQNPTEIPGVTNAEMLRSALVDRGIKESIFEFNKRLDASAKEIGLDPSFVHRNINEFMSGGEKKKNEMLQIEVLRPSLILLDELDSGLDIDSLKTVSLALNKYKEETKASILMITHHTNILKYIHPDKVYVLENSKISMSGDASLAEKIEKYGFSGTNNISEGLNHE